MAILAAPGPDHYDHPIGEEAHGRDTGFAIVSEVVDELELDAIDNLTGIGKIQAAFRQCCLTFRFVPSLRD